MKLTQEQIEILRNGKIEENKFYLQGQLDRKQYLNINEVLETIGLKWNKGKKAHIAELTSEELAEALGDVIDTGEVETLKETIKKFQFYPTPKEVAEYLVELAEIKEGERVLEPSAGLGDIFELLPFVSNQCKFIELDENKFNILVEKYGYTKSDMWCGDFLDFDGETFDKIVANPPFSKSQDVRHILHMYELLNQGGRIVSIAGSSIKTREGKLYDELKSLNPEFLDLPQGSFKESGTMANSCIVIINK